MPDTAPVALDRANARGWFAVAITSLVLAGVLALVLVLGRIPGLAAAFGDPLFFRRGLVVHVNLSLVVWFSGFLAMLFYVIPARGAGWRWAGGASALAMLGMALLVMAAAWPGARPILSNYVPVVDHGLFLVGLAAVGGGVAGAFLDARLLAGNETAEGFFPVPPAARVGVRAAAVAFLIALVTFVAGVVGTPSELPAEVYYELVFWGGGHVLQFASVAGMVAAWLILLGEALGRSPVSRPVAAVLFGVLILPLLAAPPLAIRGTTLSEYRAGFTLMMQWGIFPVVSIFITLCVREVLRARREGRLPQAGLRDGRLLAFAASALMTLFGFILGSLIRGSNTMVPGHYHASIGAVTVAYMAVAYPLLPALGLSVPAGVLGRAARWQPVLYAAGQAIFAAGFALAGAQGALRKTYASEQQTRSLAAQLGLGVMGLGGLVAIAGGILFLWIIVVAWRRQAISLDATKESWHGRTDASAPAVDG